jgi:AraC family transcriptional regulator of arabinose operon
MSSFTETPHVTVLQLLTGHFHKRSGYRTYRQRGVEDWLLIYTGSGRGRFGYPGGEIISEPGQWALLRPGTLHDYGAEASHGTWELLWTHFQPRDHWRQWLNWPAVSEGLMLLDLGGAPDHSKIVNRFFDAHQLLNSSLRQRELFAMNALEEVLLWCDQYNPLSAGELGDARVLRAMDYLAQHLERKVTLIDLAREIGLSPSRLAHLFKGRTGHTPQQFLESCRMKRAADLLERTTFSVKQIAAAVGFDSPFYFSLRFKAWARQSPTAFREASLTSRRARRR